MVVSVLNAHVAAAIESSSLSVDQIEVHVLVKESAALVYVATLSMHSPLSPTHCDDDVVGHGWSQLDNVAVVRHCAQDKAKPNCQDDLRVGVVCEETEQRKCCCCIQMMDDDGE